MEAMLMLDASCRLCSGITPISCTVAQLTEFYLPRQQRRLMQEIFPDLSIGDRELLISGTCNTCWQKLYGSEEEEI
jgi:hypothetical protein